MHNNSEKAETPAQFLEALSIKLKAVDKVDAELAAALAQRLLTTTPTGDAVDRALDDIKKLATERATPKVESAPNA